MQERIGYYKLLAEQVTEYEADVNLCEAAGTRRDQRNADINAVQDRRGDILRRHDQQVAQLNRHFGRVLERLLPQATGSIVLHRDGLTPQIGESTGEALGTAEKVIGFDLACLIAALFGLGKHPRLLIHDSPREGDLEVQIYHRLFQLAVEIEGWFPKDRAPFQYIITTTTPPPVELSGDPYVRWTLHGRSDHGLLFGERF